MSSARTGLRGRSAALASGRDGKLRPDQLGGFVPDAFCLFRRSQSRNSHPPPMVKATVVIRGRDEPFLSRPRSFAPRYPLRFHAFAVMTFASAAAAGTSASTE